MPSIFVENDFIMLSKIVSVIAKSAKLRSRRALRYMAVVNVEQFVKFSNIVSIMDTVSKNILEADSTAVAIKASAAKCRCAFS